MNYIKMSPLSGLSGYGGGTSGLSLVGGGVKMEGWFGDRGVNCGGNPPNNDPGEFLNVVEYFDITTASNASDFGDMLAKYWPGCYSNASRGVIHCGQGNSPSDLNKIEYITISTTGNSSTFGNAHYGRDMTVGFSDGTRGGIGNGYKNSTSQNSIEYVTIDTTGNATDFGDRTLITAGCGSASDDTYAVFIGGRDYSDNNNKDVMDYITIQTTGNATDYGDLSSQKTACSASCGQIGRGLVAGGSNTNVIDYFQINTPGNATDFGDLLGNRNNMACCANATRSVWCGGYPQATQDNVIQYVEIQTSGNSTDFGDLTGNKHVSGAMSGAPS